MRRSNDWDSTLSRRSVLGYVASGGAIGTLDRRDLTTPFHIPPLTQVWLEIQDGGGAAVALEFDGNIERGLTLSGTNREDFVRIDRGLAPGSPSSSADPTPEVEFGNTEVEGTEDIESHRLLKAEISPFAVIDNRVGGRWFSTPLIELDADTENATFDVRFPDGYEFTLPDGHYSLQSFLERTDLEQGGFSYGSYNPDESIPAIAHFHSTGLAWMDQTAEFQHSLIAEIGRLYDIDWYAGKAVEAAFDLAETVSEELVKEIAVSLFTQPLHAPYRTAIDGHSIIEALNPSSIVQKSNQLEDINLAADIQGLNALWLEEVVPQDGTGGLPSLALNLLNEVSRNRVIATIHDSEIFEQQLIGYWQHIQSQQEILTSIRNSLLQNRGHVSGQYREYWQSLYDYLLSTIDGFLSIADEKQAILDEITEGIDSREFGPSIEWACTRVAVDADQYDRVVLTMNDGTQEVFTGDYSGRTVFAYEGYRGKDRTTADNPADETYSDYRGTIQNVTISNGDQTITSPNETNGCPDTIRLDCSAATIVGENIDLTGFRVDFTDGSYKDYTEGDFGSTITFDSPGRVIESVFFQERVMVEGTPMPRWFQVPNPNTECDPGKPATTFDCTEVTVTPDEGRVGETLHSGSVTLEFTDGSTQEVSEIGSEIEFPATFSGAGPHDGKVIEAVVIDKMAWGATHYLVNPEVAACQPETESPEEHQDGDEDQSSDESISVITGEASPLEETPRFVEFTGRVEGVPDDTSVTVGFDLMGDAGIWGKRWSTEITPNGPTEFSTTERMSAIDTVYQYRAFVKTNGESSKRTGETKSVRVPNFIDTVAVETVDVSVSGVAATVTGRITDFGKATSVSADVELDTVDDQGGARYSISGERPTLSPDGQREFTIELRELEPNTEYTVRAKATLPSVPGPVETTGNALQFTTGDAPPEADFDPDILDVNSPVRPGEVLTVTARIENVGDAADTQDVTLGFTFNPGTTEAEVRTVATRTVRLYPGETTTVTFEYEVPDLESSQSRLIFVETDNQGSGTEIAIDVPGPESRAGTAARSSTESTTETPTSTGAATETPTEAETESPTETATEASTESPSEVTEGLGNETRD